jgi:rhodanese-related sulfurtransferase
MFCIMLKEITSKELLNKLSKVQLIDIREKYEHEEGHIKPSINIPMGEFLEKLDQLDKSKQIIIYCNTARRSKPVVYMAYKLHGIILYNLEGGYKNFLKTSAK